MALRSISSTRAKRGIPSAEANDDILGKGEARSTPAASYPSCQSITYRVPRAQAPAVEGRSPAVTWFR